MVKKWLTSENLSGESERRKREQGLQVLRVLSRADSPLAIPFLAEQVKLSVPTVTRIMGELKSRDLVREEGKMVTESGRKPVAYSIRKDRFFALGVEILLNKLQVSIVDINLQKVFCKNAQDFTLENTNSCRDFICRFINETVSASNIRHENIIGTGVGITGRVNSLAGKTYNFFEFGDIPFATFLSKKLDLPVVVENDTRVVGLYESVAGKVKNVQNALIVNISSGIGMTLIANQKIITGNSGFAGEFGHMQFAGNDNRACICGKRGCLDTEVSGKALEVALKEALKCGEHSNVFSPECETIHYSDIIKAANEGDLLSITMLQKQGEKLGYALGNIINLLNPEIIVISGKYAEVEAFFSSSVKTGLYKIGLKSPLSDCEVVNSGLSNDSGSTGAASLVFKKHDLL